jgi:hypothetical protein
MFLMLKEQLQQLRFLIAQNCFFCPHLNEFTLLMGNVLLNPSSFHQHPRDFADEQKESSSIAKKTTKQYDQNTQLPNELLLCRSTDATETRRKERKFGFRRRKKQKTKQ